MAREMVQYYGTGRRKTSTARVFLRPGTGRMFVNKRPLEEYFCRETLVMDLKQPLTHTETVEQFDAYVTVKGGGHSGQAGAIRLGLARALTKVNPDYRGVLKPQGLMTRDARKVERKKYGRAGARRRFQFSKR
ncbi:MAG: 30S ribosomal protein S9 [Alphaproteobacteria bacterium]|nr:30S ribosomal protein S9 [Alphaproteobacteria bacterium]